MSPPVCAFTSACQSVLLANLCRLQIHATCLRLYVSVLKSPSFVAAGELAVEPVQIGEAQALVGRDGIGRACLATFSLDTAALECGVTLDELQLMVQGQTPDRDGYTWAVESDDFRATVVRTNLVGRVVAKYGSVAAAARSAERLLGRPVGETGMLRLMRERELVDGTHSYHEAEVFDPALLSVQVPGAHGRSRTCTQLDSNGKALRIFPSIKLAAEAACVDYSNFRKSVTSGGMVAGHRWRVAQSKGKRAREEPLSDAEEESELPEPPKQVLPSGPGGPSAAVKRPRPAASADVKPLVPSGPGGPSVDPRISRLRVLMKSFESASLVGKTAMFMISLNACPIDAMDMFE